MALKPCRECGQEVSRKAKVCPQCGIRKPVKGRKLRILGVTFLGLFMGLCTIGMFVEEDPAERAARASERAAEEREAIRAMTPEEREELRAEMAERRPAPTSRPAATPPRVASGVAHARQTANIRSGPGTEHDVVRQLEVGEMVVHGNPVGDWLPIFSSAAGSDTIGFVSNGLLRSGATPALLVVDHGMERGQYGNRYVVGTVRNMSSRNFSYAQVEVSLLRDGTLIGSTLDNVNNLRAGQDWRFRAVVTQEGMTHYRVEEASGW